MATISISVESSLINPANYFVGAVYDAGTGSLLEFIAPAKGGGYTDPFQITFLNSYTIGKVYRVIVWENTVNTGPGGTSRVSGSVTPTTVSVSMRADEILTYGVSGVFTDNVTIVDASLISWTISYEEYGSGTLTPGGVDYTFDNTTGTIVLTNGTTYVSGQKMVIHFLPQVSSGGAPPSAGVTTGAIIAVNTTIDNTYENTAIYLKGSGGSFILTLPALSTISDYEPIEIYSAGGNHPNVTLLCQGTDKIQLDALYSNIILGQAESLIIFKANGQWNIKAIPAGILQVGELIFSYRKQPVNTVQAAGQLLLRATYPRLWAYVQLLEASCVTTEAAWANTSTINGIVYNVNKGKYTPGDGSTNFRVPLLYNYGSLKIVDGSARFPGSFQNGQVGAFNGPIPIPMGDSFLGPGATTQVGRGAANPNTLTPNIAFNAGQETYPTNIGIYGLIRI